MGIFESKETKHRPTLAICVVTMESVEPAASDLADPAASDLAERYARLYSVLEALRESNGDARVAPFRTVTLDVCDVALQLKFVRMPENMSGMSAFRLLSRMWPTLDGIIVLANALDMRRIESCFSSLFLRNLSGLPSDARFPRLLLCHETWTPWSWTRLLLLSQRGGSSLPMLPSGAVQRIHAHLADRGCWTEDSQPDVQVRLLCSSMTGPWAVKSPCAVRCLPPYANDESLRHSLDWLLAQIKAQKTPFFGD
jgi:hypothetical protein